MTAFPNAEASPAGVTNSPSVPSIFVGIDVAKDKWDVHILPEKQGAALGSSRRRRSGATARLSSSAVACLVVLEASGGYEAELLYELQKRGHLVAKVNPRQVRLRRVQDNPPRPMRSTPGSWPGSRRRWLVPSELVSQQRREMMGPSSRRRQLVKMRVMEANRLPQTRVKQAKMSGADAEVVRSADARFEREIKKLLDADDEWKPKNRTADLGSGDRRGPAAMLVCELPELGNANRQRSPRSWEWPRSIATAARSAAHAPRPAGESTSAACCSWPLAVAAIRSNPVNRAFSQRLAIRGKTYKQRVIACMRKLLVILNTILKTKQPWCDKMEAT